jgi:four helix bundle suffix protein
MKRKRPGFILPHGNYRELLSYKKAKVVYDVTFAFCRSAAKPDPAYDDFREFCETRSAEVVANIAICLIHQTNYLLDQQIRRLERDFINEGGIRERMARVRLRSVAVAPQKELDALGIYHSSRQAAPLVPCVP